MAEHLPRRAMLGAAALGVLGAAAAARSADAQQRSYGPGAPPQRYPDPDIVVLDPKRFTAKLGNAAIRRLHTGMGWAEGRDAGSRVDRGPRAWVGIDVNWVGSVCNVQRSGTE